MNKIGLGSLAAIVLSSAAFADRTPMIYGGELQSFGTFTGTELAIMRGARAKDSALFSTNFTTDSNGSSYTVGNVGTSVAGTTPGQGGWYTYSSGTANSDFKIISTSALGRTGQGASIRNGAGASSTRYMYQDLSAQWAARNTGDDILWAEWTQYAGSTSSTTANLGGVALYDSSYNVLAGMLVAGGTGLGTNYAQRTVFGTAYYTDVDSPLGNYFFKLSGSPSGSGTAPLAKSAGWTNYATSFNRATGETSWFYSVDNGATYVGYSIGGAAAGSDLLEVDLEVSNLGAASNAAATFNFGDVDIYATPAPGAAALVGLAGLMARRRRA